MKQYKQELILNNTKREKDNIYPQSSDNILSGTRRNVDKSRISNNNSNLVKTKNQDNNNLDTNDHNSSIFKKNGAVILENGSNTTSHHLIDNSNAVNTTLKPGTKSVQAIFDIYKARSNSTLTSHYCDILDEKPLLRNNTKHSEGDCEFIRDTPNYNDVKHGSNYILKDAINKYNTMMKTNGDIADKYLLSNNNSLKSGINAKFVNRTVETLTVMDMPYLLSEYKELVKACNVFVYEKQMNET